MSNILLVEPDYKRRCAPLGLMKISTMHKELGDDVQYVRGTPIVHDGMYNEKHIDMIYITSLFTWDADIIVNTVNYYTQMFPTAELSVGGICATVLWEYIYENTGVMPHRGFMPEVEDCVPDYDLITKQTNYSFGYTTRGCTNKCGFCLVPKLEPEYVEIPNWDEMIDVTKDKIILWDNNFLASSPEHFKSVVMKLIKYKKLVDFNQGLDARLFTEFHARLLSKIRIHPMRFAYDGKQEDGYIEKAIDLARLYGINDISCYALYNYTDSPQNFFYRLKVLNRYRVNAFPMKYAPPTVDGRNYIGKKWKPEYHAVFREMMSNFMVGMIGQGCKPDKFDSIFGIDEDEFMDKITGKISVGSCDVICNGQSSMFDFK